MITLLMTTEAQDMSTGFSEMQNDAGDRVYSSFSSGDYVQRTEALKQGSDPAIPADATVLYVIMYLDSTWLGKPDWQAEQQTFVYDSWQLPKISLGSRFIKAGISSLG